MLDDLGSLGTCKTFVIYVKQPANPPASSSRRGLFHHLFIRKRAPAPAARLYGADDGPLQLAPDDAYLSCRFIRVRGLSNVLIAGLDYDVRRA